MGFLSRTRFWIQTGIWMWQRLCIGRGTSHNCYLEIDSSRQEVAQEADLEGEYEGVVGTRTKLVDEACNQGGGGSVGHPVAVSFGQVAEQ